MKHLSEIPAPSEIRPEIPPDLDLVVLRALAKEPADRYQSAVAMDATPRPSPAEDMCRARRRRPPRSSLSGARGVDQATAITQVRRRARTGAAGYPPEFDPRPRRRNLSPGSSGRRRARAARGRHLPRPRIQTS